ncbi:MAG: hypothetical protein IJC69_01140 [Clostridia bacterium]|nr:hypothetical protein [Clostridia bacterium]
MGIFEEFFIDSDLLLLGIIVMLLAFLIPVRKDKIKANIFVTAICLIVYLLAELIGYLYGYKYIVAFFCLFTGGMAFSIFVGRGIKLLISLLKK